MILVTGATGHIGSTLVRDLIARGESLRALILPGEDCAGIEGLPVERAEGNVLDPASLSAAMRGVDTVFHLAGVISIMPGRNEMMRAVNVRGTMNVARAAREAGVRRMVYTSSIHALGRPPHGTCIDEATGFDPCNPAGEYDRTKAEATLAVLAEVERGLDAVIVCPTGVIGPHDYRESEMGHLIRSWMRKRPHVYVNGWFDWVDARDISKGLMLAADKGVRGETYILSGNRVHLGELLTMVQESGGARTPSVCIPTFIALAAAPFTAWISRIFGTKPNFTSYSLETILSNSLISHDKARLALGYNPRPLSETVRDTVAWWREHEAQRAAAAAKIASALRPATGVVHADGAPARARVAVITGASSGIGAATARRLASEGYSVVLTARREDRLNDLAEVIRAAGGTADVVTVDLAAPDGPQALHRRVTELHGGADVLINNAGFGWYGYLERMPQDMARSMIQLNTSALVQLTLLFLPLMKQRKSGHIVNISSVAGSIPSQGVAVYAASKSFVDSFTTALHRELGGSGVHVSALRPGPVSSEFFKTAAALPEGGNVPAERFGVGVDQVARAVSHLLKRPRRVAYVPWGLRVTPWVEAVFGWVFNLLGPMLLRRKTPVAAGMRR
jgi:dihydroflavonol-4-reductase